MCCFLVTFRNLMSYLKMKIPNDDYRFLADDEGDDVLDLDADGVDRLLDILTTKDRLLLSDLIDEKRSTRIADVKPVTTTDGDKQLLPENHVDKTNINIYSEEIHGGTEYVVEKIKKPSQQEFCKRYKIPKVSNIEGRNEKSFESKSSAQIVNKSLKKKKVFALRKTTKSIFRCDSTSNGFQIGNEKPVSGELTNSICGNTSTGKQTVDSTSNGALNGQLTQLGSTINKLSKKKKVSVSKINKRFIESKAAKSIFRCDSTSTGFQTENETPVIDELMQDNTSIEKPVDSILFQALNGQRTRVDSIHGSELTNTSIGEKTKPTSSNQNLVSIAQWFYTKDEVSRLEDFIKGQKLTVKLKRLPNTVISKTCIKNKRKRMKKLSLSSKLSTKCKTESRKNLLLQNQIVESQSTQNAEVKCRLCRTRLSLTDELKEYVFQLVSEKLKDVQNSNS